MCAGSRVCLGGGAWYEVSPITGCAMESCWGGGPSPQTSNNRNVLRLTRAGFCAPDARVLGVTALSCLLAIFLGALVRWTKPTAHGGRLRWMPLHAEGKASIRWARVPVLGLGQRPKKTCSGLTVSSCYRADTI